MGGFDGRRVLFFQATRVLGLWGLFWALQQGAETTGPCLLHRGGANLVPVKHETWGDLNLTKTNSENCLNKRLVRFLGKSDGMKGGLLCENFSLVEYEQEFNRCMLSDVHPHILQHMRPSFPAAQMKQDRE